MNMQHKDTIYIIGAGAVGKALAVFLKLAGKQVILIRGSVDDGSISSLPLRIEVADGTFQEATIEIGTLSAYDSLNGIIVLANKSYGNAQLAMLLSTKVGTSPIVLLQNGLGIEAPFIQQGYQQIYRCILFVTSQFLGQSTVKFKPIATCPIGIESGNLATLQYIVEMLNTKHLQFESETNMQETIWKKAIVNCVFNSICPLLEIDNGLFHRNVEALVIARRVIAECISISKAQGVNLTHEEVEQSLLLISKTSDGQLISTLQDIRNNRRTEIETLNFEIVRLAESLQKGHTVQETKLLGELTKLKADAALLPLHSKA